MSKMIEFFIAEDKYLGSGMTVPIGQLASVNRSVWNLMGRSRSEFSYVPNFLL